ncbi:hypothetical protein JRQ81_005920 [Phrynocephalus forsythii]|uniref:Uncharacterized protein n=1 Tax=Phrynocephalus forsythii TaxID=171643 RepID=A0A9Q0XHJ7_9SAUR|nr:hypothetical protein JRQ81_005920 [Phrynocephalus forsythii]
MSLGVGLVAFHCSVFLPTSAGFKMSQNQKKRKGFRQRSPPVLEYLQGILRKYPDGGQILKDPHFWPTIMASFPRLTGKVSRVQASARRRRIPIQLDALAWALTLSTTSQIFHPYCLASVWECWTHKKQH